MELIRVFKTFLQQRVKESVEQKRGSESKNRISGRLLKGPNEELKKV